MMTKRDFQELAHALNNARPIVSLYMDDEKGKVAEAAWGYAVDAVSDVCKLSNARFDREHFAEACEHGLVIRDGRLTNKVKAAQ